MEWYNNTVGARGRELCLLVGRKCCGAFLRLRRHFDFIGLRLSMPRQHKMIRSIDLLVNVTNVLFYGFVLPKIESNESGRRTHTRITRGKRHIWMDGWMGPLLQFAIGHDVGVDDQPKDCHQHPPRKRCCVWWCVLPLSAAY